MEVIGKVLTALAMNVHLMLQDIMPVIWESGSHRLYQWEVISRDDDPFSAEGFETALLSLNTMGVFKPQLHSVDEYPVACSNLTNYYVTVYL